MNNYKFGVTGKERKALVTAISELLNTESQYLGIQKAYAYQIGEDFIVDKEGTVTGELPTDILEELAERGFQAEIETVEEDAAPEADTEMEESVVSEAGAEMEIVGPEMEAGAEMEAAGPEMEGPEKNTAPDTEIQDAPIEPETPTDKICIEIPLQGFDPDSLDRLSKLVLSKEPLIKKALGVDALPIQILDNNRIAFPWFEYSDSDTANAYSQFIHALATTAKEKKRVTAKPQEAYQNEKFTMRVYLLGLGLIGREYSLIRKIMGAKLDGNSAWRFGAPDKAVKEAASAPQITEIALGKTPADEASADTALETETPNVTDTSADEGEVTANA